MMNNALSVDLFRNVRMTLRCAMKIALFLLNVSVIGPASIVGIALAADYLAGQNPFNEIVVSIYQYADTSIRPASAGFVLVTECHDPATSPNDLLTKPRKLYAVCQNQISKELRVEEAIETESAVLIMIYQILLVMSFCAFLLMDQSIWRNAVQMVGWAYDKLVRRH